MPRNLFLLCAFLCGLGSSLFVQTPLGRVALFDLVCFGLGPVLYCQGIRKYSKDENKVLFLAVLWIMGSIWANWWREEDLMIAVKGVAIVSSVWCMMVVSMAMLKKDYRTLLWFVVGTGFSYVFSLYYFKNGALLYFAETAGYSGEGGLQDYLLEKQVYPVYFIALIRSVCFPLVVCFSIPWFPIIGLMVFSSFFMLFRGGSRSGFGLNLLSSFFFISYCYFRNLTKSLLKNLIVTSIAGMGVIACIFFLYTHFASTGALGEVEYDKYMNEMVDSDSGFLGSRDDLIRAWPFLKEHPIVGAGASKLDRWGYMEDSYLLPGHSALVGSWVQDGVFGLIFWAYGLYLVGSFMRTKVLRFQRWAPFLLVFVVTNLWNILFSPFGGYRGEIAMFLALSAVARDRKWMIFTEDDLIRTYVVRKVGG